MANNTEQVPRVLVNRVSEQAVFPSGGILSSSKRITILNGAKTQVPTDLKLTVPVGFTLQIAPIPDLLDRSFTVSEGWISQCPNTLVVVDLCNYSGSDIELNAGDQFAQFNTLKDQIIPEIIDVTPPLD